MNPVMAPVDRHVVIVTAAGSFTAAGERLTGRVDAIDKLEQLIDWAHQRGGLQPLPAGDGDTEPGRVWLVGGACGVLSGSHAAADVAVAEQIGQALAPLVTRGWELRARPTTALMLTRGQGAQRLSVEILAEPQPWLAAGAQDVADDPAELGRRLRHWYAAVGTLPATSAAASAAVLSDHIMRARTGRRGAVVSTPGALPAWVQPEARIQPAWCASAAEVEQEFERSDVLVYLTQQCPQLASAGMLTLGHGQPQVLDAAAAAGAAAESKRPFGLWRVTLPPANDLTLPAMLPLPHPQMRADEPTQAWLTTEDLDGLAKDVRDGGAGLTAEQLAVGEAIVWPQQGRILEAWATRLREARETFRDDSALQSLVEAAAADYLTALAEPDTWSAEAWRHHFQPAWAAAIATHVRFRGRRAATRISREYRAWPVYAHAADMIYTPGRDETTGTPIDLSDTHTRLGRMVITQSAAITDKTVLAVLLAESTAEVAEALTAALGVPTDYAAVPAPTAHDSRTETPEAAVTDPPVDQAPTVDATPADDEVAASPADEPQAEPVVKATPSTALDGRRAGRRRRRTGRGPAHRRTMAL